MEKWKRIPNYSRYEASTYGRIKTFNWKGSGQERIMTPAKDKSGYLRTTLIRDDGIYHPIKVHRIIAQTFIPNPFNLPEVNHLKGIKDDNRVTEIEWSTRRNNIKHSFDTGLQINGFNEDARNVKLTNKQVQEIRNKYVPRKYSLYKLANEYGIGTTQIHRIISQTSRIL